MTNTLKFFKTGKVTTLLTKDLKPEIVILCDYGFTTEVLGVSFKIERTVTIEPSIRERYKIHMRTALIGPLRIIYK